MVELAWPDLGRASNAVWEGSGRDAVVDQEERGVVGFGEGGIE
jgi:hypothetical protein